MKHFIAVFLFLYIGTSAQTHRFIYEVNYKKDSTSNIITKEFYHLDINPENVEYYGRDYFIMDSLMTNNVQMTEQNSKGSLGDIIIHDKNSQNYDNYELLQYDMIHLKSVDKQKWKLSKDKKTLGQYSVQKAETSWGGRHWTAWFAEAIPFPEGPYKFNGLPGIIMELSDSKGNYNFKLIRSENFPETVKSPVPSFFISKAVLILKEKYVKTKMMYYNDPLAFLKNMNITLTSDNYAILKDGTKVTLNNQKEVIAKQQKLIRDYNNPIELDQAINYPSK
ncbi:GLPGLI family protein [Halpernia humi]|uniref:GLPGLI family protein n=1 Tax=Halpernia humi TaxID=493375 RepID=A0A1H5V3K1_9FLAO|nr:GLPGLI family protein [Halpernia humi]SEF81804.1 GLPGLI family protein [Halpernia humi]